MYAKCSEKVKLLRDTHIYVSVSGVRNANFSYDFSYVLNEWSLSDLFMSLRLNWGRLFKVNNVKEIVTTEE